MLEKQQGCLQKLECAKATHESQQGLVDSISNQIVELNSKLGDIDNKYEARMIEISAINPDLQACREIETLQKKLDEAKAKYGDCNAGS